MELVVFAGIPASGKSTESLNYREKGYEIVSSDEIRGKIMKGVSLADVPPEEQNRINALVFETVYKNTEDALRRGVSVVVDATHLNRGHRMTFLNYFSKFDCPKKCVLFITPFELCMQRNSKRTGPALVPEKVMYRMLGFFECPSYDEGWDVIEPIAANTPCSASLTAENIFASGTSAYDNCKAYLYLTEKCCPYTLSPEDFRQVLTRAEKLCRHVSPDEL